VSGGSTPIRAAVIGYGLAGRVFHAPLIAADDHYRVAAIVTGDQDRAAAAAQRHPDARILTGADQLLSAADQFDLAVIAAPTPVHARLAERLLAVGLAVVVDKPFAVHAADAERVITAAAAAGRPLTVFHNRRWDGDFRTVRRLIRSGALGQVSRFESRFEWISSRPRPPWKTETAGVDGGGVAYDLGSHLIDQAVQLFGPVEDFYGELDTRRAGGVNDDDSFIALRHECGVRSHLAMSSIVAQRGFRFRVLGAGTAYTKWGLDPQEEQLAAGLTPRDPGFGVAGPGTDGRLGTDLAGETVPTERGGYAEFYGQLARAMAGLGPVPVDPADTIAGIEIIEALQGRRHAP
jgi:scyllo-inositol 2-dehydrogenase (NADP+)